MEGATAIQQHDAMHKQISSYEKLLQHAMSRFSREKLYTVLKSLSRKEAKRQPANKGRIQSVLHLRNIITTLQDGSASHEEDANIKYIEAFLQDLQYLKDLKKYFDEKIYGCLYQYFYDPRFDLDDADATSQMSMDPKKKNDINFADLTDKRKLGEAIAQMQEINKRWDELLSEEEVKTEVFDPDSYHELVQFKDFKPFESVLRLVPDVFVKAYKSTEVAKTWWTQANKVYPRLPGTANTGDELSYKIDAIERMLARLEADIHAEEDVLANEQGSLEVLREREVRFEQLSQHRSKVEQEKDTTDKRYSNMKIRRESLVQEMSDQSKGSHKYNNLADKLEKLDKGMWQTYDHLKLLAFQLKVLHQDIDVELTVKPEIIRYVGSLEEKVHLIERSLQQKRSAKEETEKQLQEMRMSIKQMRDVISAVSGRADSDIETLDHGSTTLSIATDTSDLDEGNLNGNNSNQSPKDKEEAIAMEDKAEKRIPAFTKYYPPGTKQYKPRPPYKPRVVVTDSEQEDLGEPVVSTAWAEGKTSADQSQKSSKIPRLRPR